jgi:hypothetical protein
MVSAVTQCRGPLAVMALWARPARLLVVRSGNPLHTSNSKYGRFFATLADGLPGKPKPMVDGDLMEYLSDHGRVIESQREIPVGSRFPRPTFSRGLLFDATTPAVAGEYTGG